jgi:hypothetical protein
VASKVVQINRAPVLTLWAAVVAERLGFDPEESLTLGKCVAGLNAQAKGRRLGIFKPGKEKGKAPRGRKPGEEFWIDLCGRAVPAVRTPDGVRAVKGDRYIDPEKVQSYLEGKFGEDLMTVRKAMEELALAYTPSDLADAAYTLYEEFRPAVAPGKRGWGAKGDLDLAHIRSLA